MHEIAVPRISKWPFLLSDLVLLAFAAVLVFRVTEPGAWQISFAFLAVAAGAWIGIMPFQRDHESALKLAEAEALTTTVSKIQELSEIKEQIGNAAAQWQSAHAHSKETVAAAKEASVQMQAELHDFRAFLQKAGDTEKTHLRLEVEKARRAEGEWLQVTIRMLDHVYALNRAAQQSGQNNLIAQLGQFQMACRDAARRVGLTAFAPAPGDPFDPNGHELLEAEGIPTGSGPAFIRDTIAPGYTFQGQLARKAAVLLKGPETEMAQVEEASAEQGPAPVSAVQAPQNQAVAQEKLLL